MNIVAIASSINNKKNYKNSSLKKKNLQMQNKSAQVEKQPLHNYYLPIYLSFKSKVIQSFPYNSSNSEINNLVDNFEEGQEKANELGKGLFASAYKIENKPIVIKKSFDSDIAKSVNQGFAQEAEALSLVPESIKNSQRFITRVKTEKNNFYLLSTHVKGKRSDPVENPWTKKHFKSLLNTLYQLDKAHIYHMDLNLGNCLLTKDGQVNIIDYQWAQKFDYFNTNYNIDTPDFIAPSNIEMFERAALARYLDKLDKATNHKTARECFKQYLQAKSDYHEKRAVLLEHEARKRNIDKTQRVKTAIKYEKLQAELFKNPSAEVVNLELSRLDFLYGFRQAYFYHDPNVDKPRNILTSVPAYLYTQLSVNKFINKIDELQHKSTDKNFNEYLKIQKDYGNYWKNYFNWTPDNFNWILNLVNGYEEDKGNKLSYPDINKFEPLVSMTPIMGEFCTKDIFNESQIKPEIKEIHEKIKNKIQKNNLEIKNCEPIVLYSENEDIQKLIAIKYPLIEAVNKSYESLKAGNFLDSIASNLYGILYTNKFEQQAQKAINSAKTKDETDYSKKQLELAQYFKGKLNDSVKELFKWINENANGVNSDLIKYNDLYKLANLSSIIDNGNEELFKMKIENMIKFANLPEKAKGNIIIPIYKLLFEQNDEFANLLKMLNSLCKSDKEIADAFKLLNQKLNPYQLIMMLFRDKDGLFIKSDLSGIIENEDVKNIYESKFKEATKHK